MKFEGFEDVMETAIQKEMILGAAVAAENCKSGEKYVRGFGRVSFDAESSTVQPDSIVWIASCTKLLTAISVMQCVERGLLELDRDISGILTEWQSPNIVVGFEEKSGQPIVEKPAGCITLRQLLTHSSGMGYDGLNPTLQRYRKVKRGMDPSLEVREIAQEHTVALTFEPGQGWEYGSGLDWAGQMVERVNNGQRLGDYMAKNILLPLGMSSTTFSLISRPELLERLCAFPTRRQDGSLHPDRFNYFPVIDPVDDSGGSGLYSCATDFIKVLASLLHDDGCLLNSKSIEELFRPQLKDPSHMETVLRGRLSQNLLPGFPPEIRWNHALGGLLAVGGIHGRIGKDTMMWWGLPNSYWFIDRESGTCGIYVSQILPPGDLETALLNKAFQKAVYDQDSLTKTEA